MKITNRLLIAGMLLIASGQIACNRERPQSDYGNYYQPEENTEVEKVQTVEIKDSVIPASMSDTTITVNTSSGVTSTAAPGIDSALTFN